MNRKQVNELGGALMNLGVGVILLGVFSPLLQVKLPVSYPGFAAVMGTNGIFLIAMGLYLKK